MKKISNQCYCQFSEGNDLLSALSKSTMILHKSYNEKCIHALILSYPEVKAQIFLCYKRLHDIGLRRMDYESFSTCDPNRIGVKGLGSFGVIDVLVSF